MYSYLLPCGKFCDRFASPEGAESAIDTHCNSCPDRSDHTTIGPAEKQALEFILSELNAGREPTPSEVTAAAGKHVRLGIFGIKSKSVRGTRVYEMENKEKIEKIPGVKA